MEILVKGTPEEIAALVHAIQEQQEQYQEEVDEIVKSIKYCTENDLLSHEITIRMLNGNQAIILKEADVQSFIDSLARQTLEWK